MALFDFTEFVLSSIGNLFNSIGDTMGSTMEWVSSAYPCTFRVIVMLFCIAVPAVSIVIGLLSTIKD